MEHAEKAPMANKSGTPELWTDDRDLREIWDASRALIISLVCSAFFLILCARLSEEVFEGDLQRFDFAVRMKVHEFFSPQLTKFMQDMTFLGSIGFLTTLFAIIVAVWLPTGGTGPARLAGMAAGGRR